MSNIPIGAIVRWVSSSNGTTTEKRGLLLCFIPAWVPPHVIYRSRVKPLCLVPGDVSAVDDELCP